ncbi:MAG: toxin-antitoxin system TumE family protein [Candidatus Anammoxibacter sp.]
MCGTYSYHWQEPNKKLLIRWDNSPHHKHIETFPHHIHYGNNVLPSYQISFEEILKVIEEKL